MGWATAQLCHNTMGNCIVTQQVLRECSRLLSVSQYNNCIVTMLRGSLGICVVIHQVYCDRRGRLARRGLCRNTRSCIVTEGFG